MKINTALILCAGFGRRLNPITLNTPKPILKINDSTLLENCIKLIINLNIKKILINTFYLKEQLHEFIKNNDYEIEIEVIDDGNHILNTGGGILNLISKTTEENFLIFNPDTIWKNDYSKEINLMIELYFVKKLKNILLLVDKNLSFDKDLVGDFGLDNYLVNQISKDYIYTGCQIINRSIFKKEIITNFPITKIWFNLIKKKQLHGFKSKLDFYHVTDLNIFNKLKGL